MNDDDELEVYRQGCLTSILGWMIFVGLIAAGWALVALVVWTVWRWWEVLT